MGILVRFCVQCMGIHSAGMQHMGIPVRFCVQCMGIDSMECVVVRVRIKRHVLWRVCLDF